MNDFSSLESFSQYSGHEKRKYEHITMMLEKGPQDKGFGIAISGGRDGSVERGGDTSLIVSDVIPGSPADTLVKLGDVLIAINGKNVENVEHSYAVNLLRSLKKNVYLLLKRAKQNDNISRFSQNNIRLSVSSMPKVRQEVQVKTEKNHQKITDIMKSTDNYQEITYNIYKSKQGFGLFLGNLIYVKDKIEGSPAFKAGIQQGDIIIDINDIPVESCRSSDDVLQLINKSGSKLKLTVFRPDDCWLPRPLTLAQTTQDSSQMEVEKEIEIKTKEYPTSHHPEYEHKSTNYATKIIKTDNFKDELNNSVKKRLQTADKHEKMARVQSFNVKNIPEPQEDQTEESFTLETDRDNDAQGMNAEINTLKSQTNIQKVKSVGNLSMINDTRVLRIKNIGDHIGIQLVGGNKYGIFIASIMVDSPAELGGVLVGDMILSVNELNFKNMTREDAVMTILTFRNGSIIMNVTNKYATYEKVKNQQGDDFYIRVNFDYVKTTNPRELSFRRGELIRIRDTMYGGTIGSWWGFKLSVDDQLGESGVLPNKQRAEQIAMKLKLENRKNSEMKKRLRSSKFADSRVEYRSQDRLDAVSFNEELVQIPAYVIVEKKAANFKRPVILMGLASDVYRDFLISRHPYEFSSILPDNKKYKGKKTSVKLHDIQKVISEDKHCLLDISAEGIEMLNHVNLSPIVVLIKIPDRKMAGDFREAAVSMVYGKNNDPLNKKEIKNMSRFALRFNKKYPKYLSETYEVFEQTVDVVYIEILNIIRAQQHQPIYVSQNTAQIEEFENINFDEVNYDTSSFISSASEGVTDDDDSGHEKSYKPIVRNKFEPSSSYDYTNQETDRRGNVYYEEVGKDKGRYIEIKDENEGKTVKSPKNNLKSNITSYNATYQGREENREKKNLNSNYEMDLHTVLKVPSDGDGGFFESPSTKVSLYVPPGAFPSTNKEKEFFVKIFLPKGKKQQKTTESSDD